MGNESQWLEAPLTSAIETIPEEYRAIVVAVLGARDAKLLKALQTREVPTRIDRVKVADALSSEFSNHLGPDYEPTEYGRSVDDALGAFLMRWPIERED